MKVLRIGAVLTAIAVLLCLAACGSGDNGETTPTTTTTTAAPTTTAPVRYQNLLTGEVNLKKNNNRPVAFMIGNSGYYGDIQQKHIDKADVYVEAETEGGIPRIMAVFGSIDNVPDEIGPVRSARTHFVKLAKSIDAVYCHIGGSPMGLKTIRHNGIADMNGIGGNFAKVSNELKTANKAVEHTKVFIRKNLVENMSNRGTASSTSFKAPYTFGNKKGSGKGMTVELNISPSKKVAFSYNKTAGIYQKHRTTLTSAVHKSYDGVAITAKNVIIMYDKRYYEDASHVSFNVNAGNGTLLSGGTSRSIRWNRTDNGLTFMESDGTPLTVAVGKTYICLTDANLASKTVLG